MRLSDRLSAPRRLRCRRHGLTSIAVFGIKYHIIISRLGAENPNPDWRRFRLSDPLYAI